MVDFDLIDKEAVTKILMLIYFSGIYLVCPVCLALFTSPFVGNGIVEEGKCHRSIIYRPYL